MKIKRNAVKKWIILKKSFIKYCVVSKKTNKETSWVVKPIWKRILIFLLTAILITLFGLLDWRLSNNFGVNLFLKNITSFFSFDSTSTFSGEHNNWLISLNFLWTTLKTTIVGTFIGFLLAIITSFLSNNIISNKYLSYGQKGIILFIRSFPELIFINFFTLAFFPEAAAIMIFIWFTWLWLHKYFLEAIENIDLLPFRTSVLQGNSKPRAFTKEVISRLAPRFSVLFLYSFESNIRWSSVLSALGVLGVGSLINYAGSRDTTFSQLGIPIFIIFVFMIIFEIVSKISKKYLFVSINQKIKTKNYEKLAKRVNIQKLVKIFIWFCLTSLTIYIFSTINFRMTSLEHVYQFFNQIFTPDWSVFDLNSSSTDSNPFLQILQLFNFSLLSLAITTAFTFLFLYFTIWNFRNKKVTIMVRLFVTLIRLIPIITFIFLINPLFLNSLTLLVLVLGFCTSSELTKKTYEIIDNIDIELINNLKFNGYSNRIIFFKYIMPTVKSDFLGLLIFSFEIGIRNAITFSIFSNSDLKIGHFIYSHLNSLRFRPDKAMAYVWISMFTIFFVNIIASYLKTKLKKNIF